MVATICRISTGFCSVGHWSNLIEKNCFSLIESIHNDSFFVKTFFNYHFDFEGNYFKLMERYRHLSLFSIGLHFLSASDLVIKNQIIVEAVQEFVKNFFMNAMLFQICVYVCLNLM